MHATRAWAWALTLGLILGASPALAETVEEPAHRVLLRQGEALELRSYAPQLRAVTWVEGPWARGQNEGFSRLAGYIFGNNRRRPQPEAAATGGPERIAMTAPVLVQGQGPERIAMTAPVLNQAAGAEGHEVSFVLPSSFRSLEELPLPLDERVRLVAMPEREVAAWRFSGFATPEAVQGAEAQLRSALAALGRRPQGPALLAQYNPPWTPPWWRRNELLLELAP